MARNVADFMDEIFNGVGGVSGVNDRLDNKLDKTANAVSASKLQTARSIKVSLASNSAANFDGSANVTVGVDGVLPASHGGTGVSNLQNLNVGFATTASVAATSNFATRADQDCDGNKISTTYLKAGGTVANATNATNASNDGSGRNIVNTYLTKTDAANTYLGKTAKAASATTADTATKATQDSAGNTISTTYLKTTGTAAAATKLATSRTFQTNLASTTAAGFDGTANNSHGVTGTLPVANGGTGQTSLANVTVGAASKATLDGAGNNIASTYAKKSDLPDTSKMMTTDTAQTITGAKSFKGDNNSIVFYDDSGSRVGDVGNFNGIFGLGGNRCSLVLSSSKVAIIVNLQEFQFKSDGIYLNGTRITNSN